MKYETLKNFDKERFRRLTGVKHDTFRKMLFILTEAELQKKALGGKPNNLSMEDRLLMTLEYLREYGTYFHIAASYGLSESSCYRNIKWIEDTLIKHPVFALPGRKALLKSDMNYALILIDASESPIERPKKEKNDSTQVRRKDIL
jgi:uncharacterized Fe-S cluster-containing radical SAM superfamily protein